MNYNNNTHCYNFEERHYSDGLLKNIDATYIIHLENNGRLSAIEEQLKKYHPSNRVFITFNKGYKKCKKDLIQENTVYDLIDANLNAIQHSIDNDYKTILILEDDFQFNEIIKKQEITNEIDSFIAQNENKGYLYYLGAIPLLKTCWSNHQNVFSSLGTHSVVISDLMKTKLIESRKTANDWDLYLNSFKLCRYMYHIPLCYQTFPETENQKNWGITEKIMGISYSVFREPGKFFLNQLGLDKKPEPGFTITYYLSIFIFLFICVLFIFICYMLYIWTKERVKKIGKINNK